MWQTEVKKKVQHSRLRSDMRQNFPLEKHQSIERGVGKKSVPFWLHTDALWKREKMDGLAFLFLLFTILNLLKTKDKRSPKLQRSEESLNNCI